VKLSEWQNWEILPFWNGHCFRAKIQFCHSESFTNLRHSAIWESENRKIPHEREVNTPTSHKCAERSVATSDKWGIDFSRVRYFTILGFSDDRIDITAIWNYCDDLPAFTPKLQFVIKSTKSLGSKKLSECGELDFSSYNSHILIIGEF
jgi:hypothetical protein